MKGYSRRFRAFVNKIAILTAVYNIRKDREIYIYGANPYGTVTVFNLKAQGIKPKAFIDENANRIEAKTQLPVLKPSEILCGKAKPYVIIADINATAIDKMTVSLEQYGLKAKEDFELSIFVQFDYNPHQFAFVIYAPAYDENSGGITVLYQLNELLIKHGFNSKICIYGLENCLLPFVSHKAVIVYPEVTDGNPLRAKSIVRWLLYKPKIHNPNANFTENELTFCYDKSFNDINSNPDENTLMIFYIRRETYKQTNFGKRNGCCYMIRKGKNRTDLPKFFDGPVTDDKSHEEIARIFNECEYFISYDTATMYSTYARMCGCIPIVMPDNSADAVPILTKNPWIAYGDSPEEILRSRNSENLLIEYLQSAERNNDMQVLNFVDICRKKFGIS